MGYYTSYTLKVHEGERRIQDILAEEFDNGEFDLEYILDEDGNPYDSCKWYDHEKDMRSFSKLYPDVTFVLSGEGEEAGDLWKKYFRNGKMHECSVFITYEAFDESKLR
ncbi:hypothetical protein [Mesobacillus zeae]|uniref:Uncharacterized protein n=1 Tax=Mesobacillus zeae TaxID=1917180 RepID=A0A398BGX8_9BACI|nr:hypothetical protein [Mesobacillus zeae]RID88977.1 hypothetical protein D1970_00305 [Mesobacillus zeae]